MAEYLNERGTPNACCCPIVFGRRVTAGHCPIHGASILGEDGTAEAHAIDRRKRMGLVPAATHQEQSGEENPG